MADEAPKRGEPKHPAGKTVDVPGVGKVKKTYAYVGVAVVGVLAILWWRSHNSAASATATPAPAGAGTGAGPGGGHGGNGGGGDGGGGGGHSGPPFGNNQEWSHYVITYLVDNENLNPRQIGQAIGDYLTGSAVDAQQEGWIRDAIAVGGYPPVHGPGGFPPATRVKGGKGGGKGYAANPVTGLKVAGVTATSARVEWHAASHAGSYQVTVTENGRRVARVGSTSPSAEVHGLKPGTRYEAAVLARPARPSAHEAHVSFTTHHKNG